MTNEIMKEPTIDFIQKEFSSVRFGTIRPSEMELILFYVLAYHNGDLNKSVYELANKYYITESKATKMLVEISKRFRKDTSTNVPLIRDIAAHIFEKKHRYRQNITISGDTVSFIITDPIEYRAMREELEKCQIANLYTGTGKNFKFTKADFLCFFSKYYDDVADKIKQNLRDQNIQDSEYNAMFEKSKPLTDRARKLLPEKANKILSALELVFNI